MCVCWPEKFKWALNTDILFNTVCTTALVAALLLPFLPVICMAHFSHVWIPVTRREQDKNNVSSTCATQSQSFNQKYSDTQIPSAFAVWVQLAAALTSSNWLKSKIKCN